MSTLTVSKPVAKTSWIDMESRLEQEEQHIANELLVATSISQEVVNIITQYATEIPSCIICLRNIAYPVILGCGHLFDLDCISDWARKNNTCPIDKTTIDIKKNRYAEKVIKRVSAVFKFRFFHSAQIDPITVNIDSSVQRLKSLMSLGLSIHEKNLMVAAFSSHARKEPRSNSFVVSDSEFPMKAIKLYSDTLLADNEIIKPGRIYEIFSFTKYAQFGLPCDRCYHDPEKEKTCNHSDEDETMGA